MENYEKDLDYAGAIKCAFHEPKGDLRGAMGAVVRKHDGKIFELIFWATKSRTSVELDAFSSWDIFAGKISEIGPLDKESSTKLRDIVEARFNSDLVKKFFATPEKIQEFAAEIKEKFEDLLHYEVVVKLQFETFGKERLKGTGYEREQAEVADSDVKMSDIVASGLDSAPAIPCLPKIDPIKGIPSSSVRPGDVLEVSILPNTQAGKMLEDYYNNLGEAPMFVVESVTLTDVGSYMIMMRADGGLQCVIKISGDIKMKGVRASDVGASGSAGSGSQRNIVIGGVLALILILNLVAIFIILFR